MMQDSPIKQAALDRTNGLHVPYHEHELVLQRAGVTQPTLKQLIAYAMKRGKDGVLEAGMHLPDADFEKLASFCNGRA